MDREKGPTEKWLVIDFQATRKEYEKFEINHVEINRGENHPSDALTKLKQNRVSDQIIASGRDETIVEE